MKNIVFITLFITIGSLFLNLLMKSIKLYSNFKDISFKLIVINDGSNEKAPQILLPSNLDMIEILNMKINQGHAICLANGIKYALKNYDLDNLILMDADGEDRPEEYMT